MSTIQAIPTRYAGHQFRSRLEARWAMFFDLAGIEWQYEVEAYALPRYIDPITGDDLAPRAYLPDFYLPASDTWVEVKGSDAQADWWKLADAVDFGGCLPRVDESWMEGPGVTTRGLLLLGPIPRIQPVAQLTPWFPLLQHRKGIHCSWAAFDPDVDDRLQVWSGDGASTGYPPDIGATFDRPRWSKRELHPRCAHGYVTARTYCWWDR